MRKHKLSRLVQIHTRSPDFLYKTVPRDSNYLFNMFNEAHLLTNVFTICNAYVKQTEIWKYFSSHPLFYWEQQ